MRVAPGPKQSGPRFTRHLDEWPLNDAVWGAVRQTLEVMIEDVDVNFHLIGLQTAAVAVPLAIGITMGAKKKVMGLWPTQTVGGHFWTAGRDRTG